MWRWVAVTGAWTELGPQTEQNLQDGNLTLCSFEVRFLSCCDCLGISLFLCCGCTYSLSSLNMLSTFHNPATRDCYLDINLGAHPFHLSSDASGDICLRMFPLVVHIPLLALWRHRVTLGIISSCSSSSGKGWKILHQKSVRIFWLP